MKLLKMFGLLLLAYALCFAVLVFVYPPLNEMRQTGTLEAGLKRVAARQLAPLLSETLDGTALTVEDAETRRSLPQFRTLPALDGADLTPATEEAQVERDSWQHSFGTQDGAKFTSLLQINRNTVASLKEAWTYETPESASNVQVTPIYTGFALVLVDSRNHVVALDPATRQVLWEFSPPNGAKVGRGLTYLPAKQNAAAGAGHLLLVAGGQIHKLDSLTGVPVSRFGRGGKVTVGYDLRTGPVVDGNRIIVASYLPGLHAYDLEDGAHLWTLNLHTGQRFSSTISRALTLSFGPTSARIWGGLTLDETRHLVFAGTSDPGPVGVGITRTGDNRPANSVVAVDTQTGALAWVFQDVAHDLWDLDVSAPPLLGTVTRNGRPVDVVLAATKSGNLFVLDRLTGKPVFDVRQRRAPTSLVPGERTAPYQHAPLLPEPFGGMTFSPEDVTDIGAENTRSVLSQIDAMTTGFFAPHYPNVPTVFFGLHGGASHLGSAFDPGAERLFVASSHVPALITISGDVPEAVADTPPAPDAWKARCAGCHGEAAGGSDLAPALRSAGPTLPELTSVVRNGVRQMAPIEGVSDAEIAQIHTYLSDLAVRSARGPGALPDDFDPTTLKRLPYDMLRDHEGFPGSKPPWGKLTAYDAAAGTILWQVPLGHYETLLGRGLPPTGTQNIGGPISTAGGLVFVSGTLDHMIRAFDAQTGAELWSHTLPFVGSASPMSFLHEGVQYIVIPATGGGTLGTYYPDDVATGSAIVAFRLPALPEPVSETGQ